MALISPPTFAVRVATWGPVLRSGAQVTKFPRETVSLPRFQHEILQSLVWDVSPSVGARALGFALHQHFSPHPTRRCDAAQETPIPPAGTIAYRCKTCQVMSQSALCVECFRAGNHEGHDFSMYRCGHSSSSGLRFVTR